MEVQLGRHLLP